MTTITPEDPRYDMPEPAVNPAAEHKEMTQRFAAIIAEPHERLTAQVINEAAEYERRDFLKREATYSASKLVPDVATHRRIDLALTPTSITEDMLTYSRTLRPSTHPLEVEA